MSRPLNKAELDLMARIFDCTAEVCRCGEHRDSKRVELPAGGCRVEPADPHAFRVTLRPRQRG